MRNKLSSALGAFGSVIFYIIGILLTFAPLFILDWPIWVKLIIVAVLNIIPVVGNLLSIVLWVIGFFATLNSPQDIIAIIYYVLFALNVVIFIIGIVSLIKNKAGSDAEFPVKLIASILCIVYLVLAFIK